MYKLEADVAVTKNANSLLSSCLVDTEKQCWAIAQYSRRETLKILGLPESFINDKVEKKACQIFLSPDRNVNKDNLDACHRLKDKERVIAKFFGGNDWEKATYGS